MTSQSRPNARPAGGKGKGKQMEELNALSYREPNDPSLSKFPGAIKENKNVLAVMRDNKTWCIANIMKVRALVTEKISETEGYKREREYEYYITYL